MQNLATPETAAGTEQEVAVSLLGTMLPQLLPIGSFLLSSCKLASSSHYFYSMLLIKGQITSPARML
jgi:hypothetical protein